MTPSETKVRRALEVHRTSPQPLRVVMITRYYLPSIGGVQRHVADLAAGLARHGVEVHVLTEQTNSASALEHSDNLFIHRVARPKIRAIAWFSLTLKYLRLIKRVRPQIIHAHRITHSSSTIALIAKLLFKIPIVVTSHGAGNLIGDMARVKRARYRRVYLAALRRLVDRYIAVSREVDAELAGLLIPATRHVMIANSLDTDYFKPLPPEDRSGLRRELHLPVGLIVIYTGRLSAEKRVDRLIKVWPGILRQHPDAHLVIVGDGWQMAELKQLAGSNVHFIGGVNAVLPYLQAADIFALTSTAEGLSLSLLEALSTGLPSIVTQVGGARDVIEDQVNGLLIPVDDPVALEAALLKLLGEASLRESFGRRSRDRVVQAHSIEQMTAQILATYQAVLQDRSQ
jgi:glycosyltransferase involved in cell wall biosynthesis